MKQQGLFLSRSPCMGCQSIARLAFNSPVLIYYHRVKSRAKSLLISLETLRRRTNHETTTLPTGEVHKLVRNIRLHQSGKKVSCSNSNDSWKSRTKMFGILRTYNFQATGTVRTRGEKKFLLIKKLF